MLCTPGLSFLAMRPGIMGQLWRFEGSVDVEIRDCLDALGSYTLNNRLFVPCYTVNSRSVIISSGPTGLQWHQGII